MPAGPSPREKARCGREVYLSLAFALTFMWSGAGAPEAPQTSPATKPSGARSVQNASPNAANTQSDNRGQIRVRVEVVNVPVSVLNRQGLPVLDLTKEEFEVYEDGKRQTIRYFGKEPPLPLRVGLIFDTSNSVRLQLRYEQDAASEFVFNMLRGRSSQNQIFLQTFDATSSIVQDFTNDPELLNEKIRNLKAGGGKALFDAIYLACKEKMLKAGPREKVRRVLIVISDGRDVQSSHALDEAISMAHLAETMIYTLGIAPYGYANPGDKILEDLSQQTGGAALFPQRTAPGTDLLTGYLSHGQIGDTSQNKGLGAETGTFSAQRLIQLADSLEAIQRDLNEQYTIGYTPTNDRLDGTYRTIKVVALRKHVQVRWKPGYFATLE